MGIGRALMTRFGSGRFHAGHKIVPPDVAKNERREPGKRIRNNLALPWGPIQAVCQPLAAYSFRRHTGCFWVELGGVGNKRQQNDPAPSLGFGRGGIYGHVFVGRDESITSYTFPGRDSWQ